MTPLSILLGTLVLWQVTPAYRARQLDSEGTALVQSGHLAEAKFHHALQVDPADADAAINLGVAIHRQGRFAASIPWFEQGTVFRHRAGRWPRSGRLPGRTRPRPGGQMGYDYFGTGRSGQALGDIVNVAAVVRRAVRSPVRAGTPIPAGGVVPARVDGPGNQPAWVGVKDSNPVVRSPGTGGSTAGGSNGPITRQRAGDRHRRHRPVVGPRARIRANPLFGGTCLHSARPEACHHQRYNCPSPNQSSHRPPPVRQRYRAQPGSLRQAQPEVDATTT